MKYLKHQSEFGEQFNSKLIELKELIDNIYHYKNNYQSKQNIKPIRLHSSTLDSSSSFECISSIIEDKITMGATVKNYEELYKSYIGGTHSVLSCNSGSSANLLAISTLCQSGKLKRGDKIIVPALSWSTTIFPLVQYGLIPVFCDNNNIDFNISINEFEELIDIHTPKALMLIHTYGCPADMDKINDICKKNNILLIEDTCESMGSLWKGKKAGTFGTVSTFSSYFSHHICTLEGGLTCFNDEEDYKIAESIRSHGWVRHLDKNDKIFKENSDLDPAFLFNYIGYNLRLSEPQAAIGIQQLNQLDNYIFNRINSAELYTEFFLNYQDLFLFIKPKEGAKSSWFGFPLVLQGKIKGKRKELRETLLTNNIESRPFLAGDFTLQPVINKFEHIKKAKMLNSNSIATDGLAIPCHQDLKVEDISKVKKIFKAFIDQSK